MMTTEELIALAQSGDTEASERLVLDNAGLIWSVAKRYIGRGTDTEDLYQLGCLGFYKAVEGFDPMFGTQFSTYAVPKIAGEIRRFLRDDGTVKVSRTLKERSAQIKAVRAAMIIDLNREPTIQELSDRTGLTPEDIAAAESATSCTESISREIGAEGFTLENILTDTDSEEKSNRKTVGAGTLGHKTAIFSRPYARPGIKSLECQPGTGLQDREASDCEPKRIHELTKFMLYLLYDLR